MHARSGLAHGNLGGKGQGHAVLVSQLTHNPLGNHQLVGGILYIGRQELNLVLLIDLAVLGKVTHLTVAVLDKTAALGNQLHGLGAQILELAERSALVIAALIRCQVEVLGL